MDAQQRRFFAFQFAHPQHHAFFARVAILALKSIDPKMAKPAGEIRFRNFTNHWQG
jgi:hypothetical protein